MSQGLRIACIDRTPEERRELAQRIDSLCHENRQALGHLNIFRPIALSLEEAFFSAAPDIFCLGPNIPSVSLYSSASELKAAFPNSAVFAVLKPEDYNLRNIRRIERVCDEIFSTSDPDLRLLHVLMRHAQRHTKKFVGKTVCLSGAKGGVGVTSVTAGLAHAALARGERAVIVDLSHFGALPLYCGAERWESSEYAGLLRDGNVLDQDILERCLHTAPNGITLLLPPAGGSDIRELWLRDQEKFAVSLQMMEMLSDKYDLILIDCGAVEGILRYALCSRAHHLLYVCSNEPAAVHLLAHSLTEGRDFAGAPQRSVLLNFVDQNGLDQATASSVVRGFSTPEENIRLLPYLKFDSQAQRWMGTGNSFYTVARRGTQRALESIVAQLINNELEHTEEEQSQGMFTKLISRRKGPAALPDISTKDTPPRALPWLRDSEEALSPQGGNGNSPSLAATKEHEAPFVFGEVLVASEGAPGAEEIAQGVSAAEENFEEFSELYRPASKCLVSEVNGYEQQKYASK